MSANFAQLQSDTLAKLKSEALLANLNIKSLRDIQSIQPGENENEEPAALLDAYTVWATPRNGKIGCGAIVGMPSRKFTSPNAPGPDRLCVMAITVFEDPIVNIASSETSTGKTAEEWSDLIEAILHQWLIEKLGAVYVTNAEPNREFQGIIGYTTEFSAAVPRDDIEQVVVPAGEHDAGLMTLTNVTADALIYYTTDGSFPGRDAATGEPLGTATLYAAPFAAAVGTVIRWAAYKAGMRGSDVGQATVTA